MYDTDFDSQRLMFHPKEVADWVKNGVTKGPLYTELELSTVCNQRCNFCGVDHIVNQSRNFIDVDLAMELINGLKECGNKALMVSGHGEPLVHENADEIISYASKNMSTSVTTNGALLNNKRLHLIDGLKWIRFSVNGYDSENYSKVHGVPSEQFHKVLANIDQAVKRKSHHDLGLHIGVQMVLLPENAKGLVPLAKTLKEIGVDYFSVKPYSQHPLSNMQRDIDYQPFQHLAEELTELESDQFRVAFRLRSMNEVGGNKSYKRCYGIHFLSYVSANGDVWGCNVFAGDKRFLTGNLHKHSFKEIWQSDERKIFLDFIQQDLNLAQCRDVCRMNSCNKYLWRLHNPLDHDDFI